MTMSPTRVGRCFANNDRRIKIIAKTMTILWMNALMMKTGFGEAIDPAIIYGSSYMI